MSNFPNGLSRQALVGLAAVASAAVMGLAPSPASAAPVAAVSVASATVQPPANGILGSIASERIYDSRLAEGPLSAKETRTVCVTSPSVPAEATAVVVNVTAVAQGTGYLTLYPSDGSRPLTSNLNFRADRITPNLAVVKLGADDCIKVFDGSNAKVDVILDLQGWLRGGTATSPGTVAPLASAQRLLDTRDRGYPVPGGGSVDVQITGANGIPSSGVDAVILNVTVTDTASSGWIRAWPSGDTEPASSSMNYVPQDIRASLVVSAVGSNGKVSIRNGSGGAADIVVDAFAYTKAGDASVTLAGLQLQSPIRAWDTRSNGSRQPLAGGGTLSLSESQLGLPPGGASAAIVTVTAVNGQYTGFLQAYTGSTSPATSVVNYSPNQAVANLVVVREDGGGITIKNSNTGTVHVVVDVVGWVTAEYGAQGTVTDSVTGLPLARVPMLTYRPSYTGGVTASWQTAADGTYSYTQGISTSSYKLCSGSPETAGGAATYSYVPSCYGSYGSPTLISGIPMGSWVTGVDIALDPASTITGSVTDGVAAGTGGTVYASRISDGWTFSAGVSSGSYLVRGLPAGSYRLKIVNPTSGASHPYGLVGEWYDGVGMSQGGDSDSLLTTLGAQVVTVGTGVAVTGKNLTPDGEARLSGVTTDALNHVTSGYITIYRTTGDVMATTNSSAVDGTWSVDLHPGTYTVCASTTAGSTKYCWNGNVAPASATPVTATADLPSSNLNIKLLS